MKNIGAVLSNGGWALFAAFAAVIYNGDGADSGLGMAIVGFVLMFLGSVAMPHFLREE
jgi:hypothetical protein